MIQRYYSKKTSPALAARKKMRRAEQAIQIGIAAELMKVEGLTGGKDFFFFHPANGGFRTGAEGAIFKQMGVKPGVADFVFIFPHFFRPGGCMEIDGPVPECGPQIIKRAAAYTPLLFIELKAGAKEKEASDHQGDFLRLMSGYGYASYLVTASDIADGQRKVFAILADNMPFGSPAQQIFSKSRFPVGVK